MTAALQHEEPDPSALLLDCLHALYEAQHGQRMLALACVYLAGGLGDDEPRDLALERSAIGYLLCGWIEPGELAGMDWATRHKPLVDAIASFDVVSDPAGLEEVALRSYKALRARPVAVLRALASTIKRLDEADAPEMIVLRLHALQRQRRALAATVRAVRELRSIAGDHGAACSHLADAIRLLEGA